LGEVIILNKSKFQISVLLLSVVLLSPFLVTYGTTIDLEANQESIITQDQPAPVNKYPVEYTIVDQYATGESVVRGTRNSLDPLLQTMVPAQEASPPLSRYQTSLIGGEEIALLFHYGGSGESAVHVRDSLHMDTLAFNELIERNEVIGPTTTRYSELATGDFDGNFKDDVVIASLTSIASSDLRIQIMENWGDAGLILTADTGTAGLWDCEKVLTVVAGDFDGDNIDEFAVLGLNGSQPQIWIFEDIMNSIQSQIVHYGDNITIRTSTSPNHYLRHTAGLLEQEMTESAIATDPYARFIILKAGDRNNTGIVQYGDEIELFDQFGLNVGDVTNAVIKSDRGNNNDETGVVLYNQFFSIDQQAPIPIQWPFNKILKSGQIPRTFQDISLEPIRTIRNSDYATMDIPIVSSSDFSTNGIMTGNFDNDSYEELVLVGMDSAGWARAWVYDDAINDFAILHEISWVGQVQDIHPNVAVGDVDDDPQDEIIFSLTKSGSGRIEVYDDGFGGSWSLLESISDEGSLLHGEISVLSTGDVDGDGYDEIIFSNHTHTISIWEDATANYVLVNQWRGITDYGPYPSEPLDLHCGDVDIDGQEEILYSAYAEGLDGYASIITIWDYNGTTSTKINEWQVGYGNSMNVVTGDFASDQFTVKYLEHNLYTSDEQLIAVMAAPPTQAGISQNYGDSETSFGEGTSTSGSQTWGASASFGAYWGTEVDITAGFLVSINIAKFESEISLVAEAQATHTVTSTRVDMHTFTSDANADYVIFAACLYDLFVYEILEAPNPEFVGRNYSIHIPNTPSIEKWDREFYNSHNSEMAHDIGPETFNHTIGFVTSYPNKNEMETIAPERLESGTISVGKGGGTVSQQIDLSVEMENALEGSLTLDWKVGAGGATQIVGIMGSFGIMGGHSWGWGDATMFSCEIGDIQDDEDYIDFRYSCGLFIYVKEYVPIPMHDFLKDFEIAGISLDDVTTLGLDIFERGEGYYVLNYWVEVPLGWGEGAAEVNDYANDIIELLSNLSTLAPLVFYPVLATIPVVNLLYLWKKRR